MVGKVHTEESKKKMVKSHTGKPHPNLGKKHSEERKRINSEAQKIAMNRPEVRKRNSESNKIAHNKPEIRKMHSKTAKQVAHIRWHVNRNIISSTCELCIK